SPSLESYVAPMSCHSVFNVEKHSGVKRIWHRRLGHLSDRVLSHVLKFCNEKASINEIPTFCDACQFGKPRSLPFKLSNSHTSAPLELIHCDLWGPSSVSSSSGYNYYISFVDNFTRLTHIFPLKRKSKALSAFIQYQSLVGNRFEKRVKIVQSDWGGEFRPFAPFLKTKGIEFRHPCPHTSEQNGIVERKHRHIVEMGLSLLAQASMPLRYWWDAFVTATFIINRLPTPILDHLSPWEKAFWKNPRLQILQSFWMFLLSLSKTIPKTKIPISLHQMCFSKFFLGFSKGLFPWFLRK
ncbi:MAG: DDE-type integrase/transposase/recombinase, partial [Sweet potato little leaf phytoplasma]|nr:DDE-type integrase/transposase/recombinase [Sweet potato little leaf phytoplasma]